MSCFVEAGFLLSMPGNHEVAVLAGPKLHHIALSLLGKKADLLLTITRPCHETLSVIRLPACAWSICCFALSKLESAAFGADIMIISMQYTRLEYDCAANHGSCTGACSHAGIRSQAAAPLQQLLVNALPTTPWCTGQHVKAEPHSPIAHVQASKPAPASSWDCAQQQPSRSAGPFQVSGRVGTPAPGHCHSGPPAHPALAGSQASTQPQPWTWPMLVA